MTTSFCTTKLSTLLSRMREGYLQLPDMRPFTPTWTWPNRESLLCTIRDGHPMGSIMVWRTNLDNVSSSRWFGPKLEDVRPKAYILDGARRLQTIASSIFGGEGYSASYDLMEEKFKSANRYDEVRSVTELKLNIIFDQLEFAKFHQSVFENKMDDPGLLFRRSIHLASAFWGYEVPTIEVFSDDVEEVKGIIKRLNYTGWYCLGY